MSVDIERLESLAKAATPGPWSHDGSYVCPARIEGGTTYVETWSSVADCYQPENTKFIAAANPAAVLELIDRNKRLKAGAADTWEIAQSRARIIDQLKAENAGLKTGYEAYERVNAELRAECEKLRNSSSCVDDLSALVRQLVQHLRKAAPDNDLAGKALDYLKRKGLQGSPLRSERDDAAELEAQKIYDSWTGHDGFVPWVKGGNSVKQDEARRLARAALSKEQSHD